MELLLKIIQNIHKSPFTTALGILLALVSAYAFLFKGLEAEKATVGFLLGAVLVGMEDPGKKKDDITPLVLIFILLSGCSPHIVSTKSEHTDSTFVQSSVRDIPVTIEADSTAMELPFFVGDFSHGDSIVDRSSWQSSYMKFSKDGKPKPFRYQSKSKRAVETITLDTAGTLTGTCECLEEKRIIQAKDSLIHEIEKTKIDKSDIKEVHTPYWYDMLARWIAIIAMVYLIAKIILRIYTPIRI